MVCVCAWMSFFFLGGALGEEERLEPINQKKSKKTLFTLMNFFLGEVYQTKIVVRGPEQQSLKTTINHQQTSQNQNSLS